MGRSDRGALADAGRALNLADLFEVVADAAPTRIAVVCGEARATYGELERRANRVAHALRTAGVGPGDAVGILARNRVEWVEVMLGALKLRAVPINVNFRYVEPELVHVFASAAMRALVVEQELAAVAEAAARQVPSLESLFVVDDGSGAPWPDAAVPYEAALAAEDHRRDFAQRSGDDPFVMFTGGTTGLPKGVLWRSEDLFRAAVEPAGAGRITSATELAARAALPVRTTAMLAPLMHGAALWTLWISLTNAGTCVLWSGPFDAHRVWHMVAREGAQVLGVVGDAMARPLADALPDVGELDLSGLGVLASGGAPLSPAVRASLLARLPHLAVVDGYGASETGYAGTGRGTDGPVFQVGGDTAVLDADLRPVRPGSGVVGRVARTGPIPLGYLGDPDKTAEVFLVDADGTRWVVPGDLATVGDDGSISLLGRGSTVINTGGEKVYPQEVEAALMHHPAVLDVLVVGLPDERFGETVAAVVAVRDGVPVSDQELSEHARTHVAAYKVPRRWVRVDAVRRSPAGKPDYVWARAHAGG